ncbi:thioredoxin [Acidipropionibacterium timonense]|uniref:thioredoxin n=1 Tax=Acidipropionibacterium timonense TaxID=2161818 RepID=UPI0010327BB6|nr:thioredoxin [Acidipropionibacterium timonense]
MSQVIEVTDATFEAQVIGSSKPVLVDYWADWCAPCKQLSPIVEELAQVYGDRMVFAKVDTNVNQQVATSQGILSLPTIQIWQGGQLVKSLQGGKTKKALLKVIDEFVG